MTKNTAIIGVAIVAGIISPETEAQPKGRGDAPREEALRSHLRVSIIWMCRLPTCFQSAKPASAQNQCGRRPRRFW